MRNSKFKHQDLNQIIFINIKKVVELTGLSKSTIYRMERARKFPERVPLTTRRVGWRAHEVLAWGELREKEKMRR